MQGSILTRIIPDKIISTDAKKKKKITAVLEPAEEQLISILYVFAVSLSQN